MMDLSIDRETLERCHRGKAEIAMMAKRIEMIKGVERGLIPHYETDPIGVMGVSDPTGEQVAYLSQLEQLLTERKKQHLRDLAAVLEGIYRYLQSDNLQSVAWTYYADGASYQQIAGQLGVSVKWVRTMVYTVRDALIHGWIT